MAFQSNLDPVKIKTTPKSFTFRFHKCHKHKVPALLGAVPYCTVPVPIILTDLLFFDLGEPYSVLYPVVRKKITHVLLVEGGISNNQ
jgi:hypothetical protein